jgi:hypothetical protein
MLYYYVDIARKLNTLGTGILAGALLMSTLALRRVAAMLDTAQQVFLQQRLIERLSKLMPPFMLLPIIASRHSHQLPWYYSTRHCKGAPVRRPAAIRSLSPDERHRGSTTPCPKVYFCTLTGKLERRRTYD